MTTYFERDLDNLNENLIKMASLVEESIDSASQSLTKKDMSFAKIAIENEVLINEKEKEIENLALQFIIKQHPVAKDLRFISAVLKIITDLERIGDMAEDICEIILSSKDSLFIKETTHLNKICSIVNSMVIDSVDAFIYKDLDKSKEVISRDDQVDELFDLIKDELIYLIRKDIKYGSPSLDLMLITKYLERIGDHAENIGEWSIYAITGQHIE